MHIDVTYVTYGQKEYGFNETMGVVFSTCPPASSALWCVRFNVVTIFGDCFSSASDTFGRKIVSSGWDKVDSVDEMGVSKNGGTQ